MTTIIQSIDGLVGDIANGSVSGAGNGSDFSDVIPAHVANVFWTKNSETELYMGAITYDWTIDKLKSAGQPSVSEVVAIACTLSGMSSSDQLKLGIFNGTTEIVGLGITAGKYSFATDSFFRSEGVDPPTIPGVYTLKLQLISGGQTTDQWSREITIYQS